MLDGLRASLKEERTWLRAWDPKQRAFVFPTNLGVPLRIYMARPEEFGLKTLLYTGPPEFNAWFEEMMRSKVPFLMRVTGQRWPICPCFI